MDRYKKLQTGELEWSSSIRDWIHEKENKDTCIYCGSGGPLTVEHMIPLSRGGLDHPDNAVWVCSRCNASKGDKWLNEYFSLEDRNRLPKIAEGKYLKLLYDELEQRGLLEMSRENLGELCEICDLGAQCPVSEDLTVYCLEGIFIK
jgi:hypothetical protein